MPSAGRRVALVSIDASILRDEGFRTFNNGARRVQAAVVGDEELGRDAEVVMLDLDAPTADELVEAIARVEPDVVGGSSYVWSFPTFVEAARRLSELPRRPTVVLGGPSARPAMFELEPFRDARAAIDALVVGDGEAPFREVVRAPDRGPAALRAIDGLAVPDGDGFVRRPDPEVALDTLPSPFQLGIAPRGVTGHLETFRGCPLRCAFCEWGVLSAASRVFSQEYLERELEAFAACGADGAFLVDAGLNLNARAFGHLAAAERATGFFRDHWFSCEAYATHVKDEHVRFLADARVHHVGVGLQSYDADVLRRLDRPFDADRFDRGVRRIAEVAPAGIEIIMGLPFDTPESFRQTVRRARELPCSLTVYHCLVLPDGLMTRAPAGSDMVFDPYTLKMISCAGWSARDLEVMRDELTGLAEALGGEQGHDYWDLPQPDARPAAGAPLGPELTAGLAGAVDDGSGRRWRLLSAERRGRDLWLRVEGPEGRVLICASDAAGAERSYRVHAGVAFSYLTPAGEARPDLPTLDATIPRLGPPARRALGLGEPRLPVVS